ncbi:MAG: hypothetical protein JKY70_00085 [Mucilaginibacter sp.]|nr:hypothetical protein [Mucilaginibacter sp.]
MTIYFDGMGLPDLADSFISHYTGRKWHCPKGTPYSNWKVLATDWIYDFLQTSKLERRRRAKTSIFLQD